MEIIPPNSYSASNYIRNFEMYSPGFVPPPFAEPAEDQGSSNSNIIKAKPSIRSRRKLERKRGGIKRVQSHQNQEDDDDDDYDVGDEDEEEADTANSYTKNPNQYKWLFEMELNRASDLSCRLLLGKELVSKKILPHLNEDSAKACQTRSGLQFNVWDVDTGTQHQLVMNKWFIGYYSFECFWKRDFVERRELKIRDKIKVGLDEINSRFCFSVVRPSQD